MPRSRIRRKEASTAPPARPRPRTVSRPWIAPAMVTFFLLGVLWLAIYYISGGEAWGLRDLGPWNLAIGFGLIMIGFGLSTQWR